MTTVYTLVSWLAILGYWLLIAGVTLRILMKRRAVPSAMAWLLIIYILPLVGIIAYLAVGELHLGKRRAERARAMWPSTAKWLNDLKACKHIFAEENSSVAAPLFKLCERRQGIAGVKGRTLGDVADPVALLSGRFPEQRNFPRSRFFQSENQFQDCRLSCAVFSGQRRYGFFMHMKGNIPEYRQFSVRKRHAAEFKHRSGMPGLRGKL